MVVSVLPRHLGFHDPRPTNLRKVGPGDYEYIQPTVDNKIIERSEW